MILGLRFRDFLADVDDRESVREALELVGQLRHRPDSHYAAMLAGGMQFLGWGEDRNIAVSTRDHLVALIMALGGKQVSQDQMYPRPQVEKPAEVATIADFNPGAFMRWFMS